MNAVRIEIMSNCRKCGFPLPLNAVTDKILCRFCDSYNEISFEKWRDIISQEYSECVRISNYETKSMSAFATGTKVMVDYGMSDVVCVACNNLISDDVFEEIEQSKDHECSNCGSRFFIRRIPNAVKNIFPGATFIAGEDPHQITGRESDFKEDDGNKPVVLRCPSCASNLKIDGTKRLIPCEFCSSNIYLPDDLWFELHPPRKTKSWFVIKNNS